MTAGELRQAAGVQRLFRRSVEYGRFPDSEMGRVAFFELVAFVEGERLARPKTDPVGLLTALLQRPDDWPDKFGRPWGERVRTADLERARGWLRELRGLQAGPRKGAAELGPLLPAAEPGPEYADALAAAAAGLAARFGGPL